MPLTTLKRKAKSNYIVFYSERASPKIKQFRSLKQARAFAAKHEKKNVGDYSDDWVDCIIEGTLIETYPNWYDFPVTKGKTE